MRKFDSFSQRPHSIKQDIAYMTASMSVIVQPCVNCQCMETVRLIATYVVVMCVCVWGGGTPYRQRSHMEEGMIVCIRALRGRK